MGGVFRALSSLLLPASPVLPDLPLFPQCERKLKHKGSLPPKYALELLTIYSWEQGSGAENFDTAEGFRTVLELITKYRQLCVFWTVNYNFEDETVRNFLLTQIQRTRCSSPCHPLSLTRFPPTP